MAHKGRVQQVGVKGPKRKKALPTPWDTANRGPLGMFQGKQVGKAPKARPYTFQEIAVKAPSWWMQQLAKQSPKMQKRWFNTLKFISRYGIGDRESFETSWQKKQNRDKITRAPSSSAKRMNPASRRRVVALRKMT